MATSYSNPGGSGDRSALITVTSSITLAQGTLSQFVNGDNTTHTHWWNGATNQSTDYVQFDFGVKKVIDESKFYQSDTTSHGTWKFQGSNDASSWSDVGTSFTLGGTATQTISNLSGNTIAYRYYRINAVSGTRSSQPWLFTFEFKIDDYRTGMSVMRSKEVKAMDDTSRVEPMRNKGISALDDRGII